MKCNLLHHYWTTTIGKAFTQKGTRPLHSGCARHRYIPIFQWDSRRLRDHRMICIRTTPDAAAARRGGGTGKLNWTSSYGHPLTTWQVDRERGMMWNIIVGPKPNLSLMRGSQLHRVMFYGLCTFVCPTRYNIRTICEWMNSMRYLISPPPATIPACTSRLANKTMHNTNSLIQKRRNCYSTSRINC